MLYFQTNYLLMFKLHLCPTGKRIKAPPALLTWNVVHERMPWNIVLLLGGGFALAAGSEVNTLGLHVFTFYYVILPYRISKKNFGS